MSDEREFLRANEIGRRGATSKRVIGKDSNEKLEGIPFDDRQVSQQRGTDKEGRTGRVGTLVRNERAIYGRSGSESLRGR